MRSGGSSYTVSSSRLETVRPAEGLPSRECGATMHVGLMEIINQCGIGHPVVIHREEARLKVSEDVKAEVIGRGLPLDAVTTS